MVKNITLEFIITSTKIIAFVFVLYAAFEMLIFKNHDLALQWGFYAMLAGGVKNVTQAYSSK